MSAGLSAVIAFGVAAPAAGLLTPAAIRLARRTGFYDHPREYRQHGAPTPFLGGAAVLIAVIGAAAATGTLSGRILVVVGCALGLSLIGFLDDLRSVSPAWRLLAEAAAAAALFAVSLGWHTALPGPGNLALTVLWVVGLVNAFNLMDNLDGACGTLGAVCAGGVGVLAAIKGQTAVAALAFGTSGACAGFLPWNLAGPAKIFLGDAGSMPVGLLVAALAMATARHSDGGNAGLLVGALLVGLPILDVALVTLSRSRRGVSLLTGGRDHLTHRVLLVVSSPRQVAGVLAATQAGLFLLAIVGYELGAGVVAVLGLLAFMAGVVAVFVLYSARWRPAGIAVSEVLGPAESLVPVALQVEQQGL